MRKRFFTLMLIIMAMSTASAHDFEVGGIYYLKNGNNATVTYRGNSDYEYSNEYTGAVNIPSTVTYNGTTYSVTTIGDYAFYNCSSLTSVTIPNSVTTIGDYAFYNCSGLTSVTIPNSVTTIGSSAFSGCSGLTSVTIPNSVTTIGDYAFNGCSGLTSVTIGNSVTSIGYAAFGGCTGLTSVNITDLAAWCNINFIHTVSNPLYYAHNLYLNGSKVTNLVIPSSVTSIGNYAFNGCSCLTSVTIPNSVTSIGSDAFRNCTGLTSVTIPNSVTSIGGSAFEGTAWYNNQPNGLVYAGMVAYKYKGTMPNGTSIILKDGCTGITSGAFYECSGLTSVTIPNSVTKIGSGAFSGCSGLTSVTIGNSVTWIGRSAFSDCSGLTSVTIPNSVTTIGGDAFANCTGLTSVTIPNSVTEIGNFAFGECSGLTSVNITDLAAWCNINFYSDYSNPLYYAHNLYLNGSKVTNLVIPNLFTTIKQYVFYGCSGLTSVTIPNSVTEIGSSAFSGCRGLTSLDIPHSVTTIGESAFNYCSGLTSVTIPNSVTEIADNVFSGCSGLTSVTIPNSVKTIGFNAFYGCRGLTSLTIPNSVTKIGSGAFSGCRGLTSLDIPNSVTSIGSEVFMSCSGLTSVTFGNSVTEIGSNVFDGCDKLRSIYSKILAPENVRYGQWIFNGGVSMNYCMLYVPVGTLDSYQFTAPWNDFLNIIEYDYGPEFIMGDANGDGAIDVADYVDVASYILEQDPQPFNFAAADLDEDNTIDVADLVGVAYLALNYEGKTECIMHNAQLTNEAREEGKLAYAIPCKEEKRNSECIMQNDKCAMGAVVQGNEVIINLSNNVDITAMQMDINLPQGMTLVDASLSDRASASHQVVFNQLANGDYRLLASSSALKCFKNNDGTVLTLTLAGSPDGNGCLRGIKLAAPSSARYSVDDIELNFTPTGVDNVTIAARIYSDGNNIIIDSPIDGTAQIVLPNGMNKTVKVATGRNVFETPIKGLIIVKMGNKVEKLQF